MRAYLTCILVLVWLPAGCGHAPEMSRDVKRLDEKVTKAELEKFLRIVERLPGKKIPEIPATLLPPPAWSQTRTLPVNDLVDEELAELESRWTVTEITHQMKADRPLNRALRSEHVTEEQFVGLLLAIGLALSREAVPVELDLNAMVERGEKVVHELRQFERPFGKLSADAAYAILQQAAWLTITDRAKRLTLVPPENQVLVREFKDRLVPMFPDEFKQNPLQRLAHILDNRGIPFTELPATGSDEFLPWQSSEAVAATPAAPATESGAAQ